MRHLILFIILLVATTPAMAATYYVNPEGTGDFPTIQAAVEGSTHGDVIELADGVFTGTGNRGIDFLGKSITIRSQSGFAGQCVIDCQGSASDPARGFLFASGESNAARLQDLTIVNGYAPLDVGNGWGGGILAYNASPTVENCTVEDCRADWGGGMLFWGSMSEVTDCRFLGCTALTKGGGIYITTDAYVEVTGGLFVGCSADDDGGAACCNNCQPSFVNCTMFACEGDACGGILTINGAFVALTNSIISHSPGCQAVHAAGGGAIVASCSDVYGNDGGNWTDGLEGQLGSNGNIAIDPLYCNAAEGDFTIASNSPCAPFSEPNPECDLIGAFDVGCGSVPVTTHTWGGIKAAFRSE